MAYKIVMPQLGLTMEEGSVTSWLKAPGDWVEKGDPLFIVETDKIEMEVESMGKGVPNFQREGSFSEAVKLMSSDLYPLG